MYCPNCGTSMKKGFCTHCGYMRTGRFIEYKKEHDEGLLSYYFGPKYDFFIRNQNWFFVGVLGPSYIFSNGYYINGLLLYILDIAIILSIFVLNHMFIFTYVVRFLNLVVLIFSRLIWSSIGNTIYLRLLNRRLNKIKKRNPKNYKELIQSYYKLDSIVIWLKYFVYGVVFFITFMIIRERQIIIMLKLYYDRFPVLQKESLDEFTKRNLELYLNSDLSIDDINDKLAKSTMKNEEETNSIEEMIENPIVEEKGFQYTKKINIPTDNEDGYISNMIITTLALMTFSLCCIGLIILYLIK